MSSTEKNYQKPRYCCLVNTYLGMSFAAVVMKMTSWMKLVLLQGMLREARNFVVEIEENLKNSININFEFLSFDYSIVNYLFLLFYDLVTNWNTC